MKLIRIILFILIIIGYSSCKKKVSNYNPDLIGVWTASLDSTNYMIDIVESGKSTYYEDWDTAYVEAKGVAKILVKKKDTDFDLLIIGKKELSITKNTFITEAPKYPTQVFGVDTHWEIRLDGILYIKED